jgi:hemoglobin
MCVGAERRLTLDYIETQRAMRSAIRSRTRNDFAIVRPMKSIYEQLGGEAAVAAAVPRFYEKVMADPSLAHYFDGLDMDAQIDKQIAFMTMAFGGPSNYTGRDLRSAHAKLLKKGLGDAAFDAVAKHLGSTLSELGVESRLVGEVLDIVSHTRTDVLSR